MPSPLFEKLKQHLGQIDPSQQEDPIPYDPNAGTLTNVGRFVANNVASDPGYAGMFPVAGSLKMAGKFAQEVAPGIIQKAEQLVPKAANSSELLNSLYAAAQKPGSGVGMKEIAAATQKNNAAMDILARRNALNKIRSR